jgi:hypothetical protein
MEIPSDRRPVVSGWHRWAWVIGLTVLALVTLHGARQFFTGDWTSAVAFWRDRLFLLPAILGLATLDVALEGVAWSWVAERFGLRVRDRTGLRVYLSGNAGRVMPAQLGRLIRPEALVRLGRGTPAQCFKAEASVFVLDVISVVALLAGLGAYLVQPLLGIAAAAGIVAVSLFLGDRIGDALSGTRLGLPPGFWWNWKSLSTVAIQMAGWIAHGLAFYVLVMDLPGAMGLWDSLFLAPGAAVLGVGTGLPGGVGATEGLLGLSLQVNKVPPEHFAVVVAAFRLVTFWCWVAIGWVFLVGIRRHAEFRHAPPAGLPEPAE